MVGHKRQARAAESRRLALAATALGETSLLAHVREKHERAAARWWALAALDERVGDSDLLAVPAVTVGPLPTVALPAFEKDEPCTA